MRLFKNLINWYFSKRTLPYWCILLLDYIIILLSAILVYWLFYRGADLQQHFWPLLRTLLVFLALSTVFFKIFRTYSGIIRYSSFGDLERIGNAMLCSMAAAILVQYLLALAPEGVFLRLRIPLIIAVFILATTQMWLMRISIKSVYEGYFRTEGAMRVFIYGIRVGGIGLAKSIRGEKPARFKLCGFISHDPELTNKSTHLLGEPVYEADENLTSVLRRRRIDAVLVAPGRVERFRNDTRLQDYILAADAKIFMSYGTSEWDKDIPSVASTYKEVCIEDLLPRDEIEVDLEAVKDSLAGKRILITGSAGSIGSEIVRQVASFAPAEMMLIDSAETPQHDIRLMMAHDFPGVKASTVVTSITKEGRMRHIFETFRPEIVFHAAAYKHVPMMEDNPSESIQNNVYGTKVIADLSVETGVDKFVMISTDKAVNPTNVMGCSKRICEIYVQSLNKAENEGKVQGHTQFVTTRFGNVLGSNGSVIPIFEKQIKAGGPVTVTDPNVIRYFMLIPEACKLVLEAGTKGQGGEIFVFDMGKPVRIADLALRMIRLSGAQDVEIEYTGLRDGEKLYEEVLNKAETTKPSFHEKIHIANVREYDYSQVEAAVEELIRISGEYDDLRTVAAMKRLVPEYVSNHSVYSVLDK
ncbi:MAG: polysaccharide biosynthesis protein [Bacteroidales bacterium]|nr:polysaccharide biosynthesis protein [Bacteroidales bacterium]